MSTKWDGKQCSLVLLSALWQLFLQLSPVEALITRHKVICCSRRGLMIVRSFLFLKFNSCEMVSSVLRFQMVTKLCRSGFLMRNERKKFKNISNCCFLRQKYQGSSSKHTCSLVFLLLEIRFFLSVWRCSSFSKNAFNKILQEQTWFLTRQRWVWWMRFFLL